MIEMPIRLKVVSDPPDAEKAPFDFVFMVSNMYQQGSLPIAVDVLFYTLRDDPRLGQPEAFDKLADQFIFIPGYCDQLAAQAGKNKVPGLEADACSPASRRALVTVDHDRRRRVLDDAPRRDPRIEPPCERPRAPESARVQDLRGAARGLLVRTRAIEHDVAIARYLLVPMLDLIQREVDRTGNGVRIELQRQGMPHIHHADRLARIQTLFELVHGNLRHAQMPEELLPIIELIADESRQAGEQHPEHQSARLIQQPDELLQLIAE